MNQSALEQLKQDHEKVKKLLSGMEEESNISKLKEIYQQVKLELSIHTAKEEQYLYPKMQPLDKDRVLEAFAEHELATTQLMDLADMFDLSPVDIDEIKAKLKVLMEVLEHHIKEEEGELFPEVEKAFSEEELIEMGQKMQAVADEEMGK